jgi:hypothetical protein
MKQDESPRTEQPVLVSQSGRAGKDLIQVGRDYVRNIQINFATGNWLMVAALVLPTIVIFYAGVRTVEYTVSKITTVLTSQQQGLSSARAEAMAKKWINTPSKTAADMGRVARASLFGIPLALVSSNGGGSISSVAEVQINESTNTAEAKLEISNLSLSVAVVGGQESSPFTFTGPAIAKYTRYSDYSWALTGIDLMHPDINMRQMFWENLSIKD